MTACAPTDRLMQTLRVHVPGATDGVIQLELFNVMDEFFRRTNAWRYEQEIDIKENTHEYALSLPADAEFVRMLGAARNGVPVPPVTAVGGGTASIAALGTLVPDLMFPDGDSEFAPSDSDLAAGIFSYAVYKPQYITITGPTDEEARQFPVTAVMALTIAKGCLECDCGDWGLEEWMYDMFFQDFLDGALGRLMGMVSKPWTNTTMAAYHARRFRNAMAFRKQEANRGFAYAVPGWRYPRQGWV